MNLLKGFRGSSESCVESRSKFGGLAGPRRRPGAPIPGWQPSRLEARNNVVPRMTELVHGRLCATGRRPVDEYPSNADVATALHHSGRVYLRGQLRLS